MSARPHLECLIARARRYAPLPMAIVYPCDRDALLAAAEAARAQLITPLLIGPRDRILASAKAAGVDVAAFELHDIGGEPAAAARAAVALCHDGRARAMMKGSYAA